MHFVDILVTQCLDRRFLFQSRNDTIKTAQQYIKNKHLFDFYQPNQIPKQKRLIAKKKKIQTTRKINTPLKATNIPFVEGNITKQSQRKKLEKTANILSSFLFIVFIRNQIVKVCPSH